MDEIRFVAGPIIQRYMDKVEEERQAALKIEEEKAAKKRAEQEATQKADEDAKITVEAKKAPAECDAPPQPEVGDVEMPDAAAPNSDSKKGPDVSEVD